MTVTTQNVYGCDFTGCTTTLTDSPDAATAAGWTYSAPPWGVNTLPTQSVRCPAHKGQ